MMILNPITALVYLVCLAINITLFFLLVRLIQLWRTVRWLTPFDKVGQPLVDGIMSWIGKFQCYQKLSEQGRIIMSLSILIMLNLLLVRLMTIGKGG